MIDYTKWPEKKLNVTSLQLDPLNPRIPDVGEGVSQRDLIADLVEHEDVTELAKDIVEQGYSPLERLLGFEEDDGKTYILEGNRRLAALKLLLNPDAAPEDARKRFRALAEKAAGGVPTRASVVLAPAREDAAGLIMQKHTRTQVSAWEPVMQARFFKNLLGKGKTVEDLAKRYGFPASEIRDRLRTLTLYEIACALPLPPEVSDVVRNPRAFKISSIERLGAMPVVREFLGVEFDAAGRLKGTKHRGEFERAYGRIITDIVNGQLDTREVNTVERAQEYLKKIANLTPKKSGRFGSEDFEEPPPTKRAANGASASSAGRSRAAPREQTTLIPKRRKCPVSDRRIREIWGELQQLRIEEVPNATAVLVRILLELAVVRYLKKTGKDQPILAADRKKNPKRKPDWFPSLRQLLNPMTQDPDVKLHPLVLKTIRQLVEQEKGPFSLESLDGFVHNPYAFPSARELRGAWALIDEVLQFLLVEDLRPSGSGGRS